MVFREHSLDGHLLIVFVKACIEAVKFVREGGVVGLGGSVDGCVVSEQVSEHTAQDFDVAVISNQPRSCFLLEHRVLICPSGPKCVHLDGFKLDQR